MNFLVEEPLSHIGSVRSSVGSSLHRTTHSRSWLLILILEFLSFLMVETSCLHRIHIPHSQSSAKLPVISSFKSFGSFTLATNPLTLCTAGCTFYFRYIVFHVSTWPPLFQIFPPTSIVRHTFCNILETPMKKAWPLLPFKKDANLPKYYERNF